MTGVTLYMTTKAILFDLDGTILDTLDDLADSVNFALSCGGHPLRTRSEIRDIVGNGVVNLITRALPESTPPEKFEECLASFKKHYETNKTNKTAPYDGIIDILRKLKLRGHKLAIVSNKHNDAVQGLFDLYFPGIFDFALGNCDFLPKKPEPDMIYYAIEKLGLKREDAVYIGDSEVDIKTARNSNIPCISVTWGFRSEETLIKSGAEIILHSPDELVDAIENI